MKLLPGYKYLFIIAFTAIALYSCSVSKEARTSKKDINGNWYLETIVTEGINAKFKARLFNEADFGCFIGSKWNFIANNSMGSYTIIDIQKDCPAVKRNIHWSIYEPRDSAKQFQFKRLDDKKNTIDNGDGFRFTILKIDDKQMKLKSSIIFEGQPAAIIYNFVRN